MNDYAVFTDSACDMSVDLLNEWGVMSLNMSYIFDEGETSHSDDIKTFYDKMRQGSTAKTTALNPCTFADNFRPFLSEGKDVLYLCFSSGLSTTCNNAHIAAAELSEEFSDNRVYVVDSLCASAGQGLLLRLLLDKKDELSAAKLKEYADEIKHKICHWFTVDDLIYLKRGGRISPTVAVVGKMLGIKPVLHMDENGRLANVTKARGRKQSIAMIAARYAETKDDKYDTIYISHGDCLDDAKLLESILMKEYGAKVNLITDIGPLIGAHSGPGTLALFYVGKER